MLSNRVLKLDEVVWNLLITIVLPDLLFDTDYSILEAILD